MRITKYILLFVLTCCLYGCAGEQENESNYGDMAFASFCKYEETWKNEGKSSKWVEIHEGGENAFLVQAGFDKSYIFFEKQYSDEKLVLYFDEKQNRGCGFLYTTSDGEQASCLGFLFEGCEVIDGDEVEPYSVYYAYDLSGVARYEYDMESIPPEDIIAYECENGVLQHISLYVTHGTNERFYIYEEGKDVPKYCLTLDPGWGACFCRFE